MSEARRDSSGRLMPGSTANPKGRPKKVVEEGYVRAFVSKVTVAEWEKVIARALVQAKKGDKDARKFLADYIVGPPVQRQIDPELVRNPYAGLSPEELKKEAKRIFQRVKLRT